MSDPDPTMLVEVPDKNAVERMSVAALVTYSAIGVFVLSGLAIFVIIYNGIAVSPVMVPLLAGAMAQASAMATVSVSYWVGSSSGAKTANAAVAQIAGAGPPPPDQPLGGVK